MNDSYVGSSFDDFLDEEEELETRPRKKFFEKFSSRKNDDLDDDLDDIDDLDEYDEPEPPKKASKPARASRPAKAPAPAAKAAPAERTYTTRPASAPKERTERAPRSSSKVTPMRSSKRSSSSYEVCVIRPTSMENTREIADTLIDNSTVILNLEGIDVELAQRIIDFTSGACYSLGGSLQKISSYIFVLGPYNVDITGDLQNILGGTVPSVNNVKLKNFPLPVPPLSEQKAIADYLDDRCGKIDDRQCRLRRRPLHRRGALPRPEHPQFQAPRTGAAHRRARAEERRGLLLHGPGSDPSGTLCLLEGRLRGRRPRM